MANDLVRVRLDDVDKNLGRAFAEAKGLEVLDEPTRKADGTLRGPTRRSGRPANKKKTSVAAAASEKKAAVIEPAPIDEEQNR